MAKSNKEKDKSFQDMLKSFFRTQQKLSSAGTNTWPRPEEFILKAEILKDLSHEVQVSLRLKTLRDLGEIVLEKRLEEYGVEKIWNSIRDLLSPSTAKETRQSCLNFVRCLVHGQYERLGISRAVIFQHLETHDVAEDLELKFEILKALTDNGKDLLYFEEKLGPVLLAWIDQLLKSSCAEDLLILLTNLIKFNSSLIDEKIVDEFVRKVCVHTQNTPHPREVTQSLEVLDACVRYSSMPVDSLSSLICALSRIVINPQFCVPAAQLITHLFGTHLGKRAIHNVFAYLTDERSINEPAILRGCVFFVGVAFSLPHESLYLAHSPFYLIPAIKASMRGKHVLVARAVGLLLEKIVKQKGHLLIPVSWELFIEIVDEIFEVSRNEPWAESTLTNVITVIEKLHSTHEYSGSPNSLYDLIEKCAALLPETSVFELLNYRTRAINPLFANWLTVLYQLMDRFYKQETRPAIRIKALSVLKTTLDHNRRLYEEDLVEQIVLPLFKNVDTESDTQVAKTAIDFLVELVRDSTSKFSLDVLQVIEKIMSKSFDGKRDLPETENVSLYSAIYGLVDAFRVKLYQFPCLPTIRMFQTLVSHLQLIYRSDCSRSTVVIRTKILDCILRLRCNSLNQIGLLANENDLKNEYSKFIVCSLSEKVGSASPSVGSPVSLFAPLAFPVDAAITTLVLCLEKDRSWPVLELVLDRLPLFLHNRSLVLSAEGAIVQLCTILCKMISDRNLGLPDSLKDTPPKFSRSDFHCHVLPVLATLVTYHKQLDGNTQRRLIKCLEFGLVSKCARTCITALTVCTLEMHDTMYRVLPGVLLSLSKISATVGNSIAILEFLSSLIRLPRLYASFVEDQYMSIFAIALPYVNPFKFTHNTVALAYHVIAMWFLKCRLPFRRDFVKFIIKGLQSNVLIPLEEGDSVAPHPLTTLMEDSSARRRASSMNEAALNRRRDRASLVSGGSITVGDLKLKPEVKELNVELTETCIDLMSRYTFASCSAIPKRFSASEFLLQGGQSLTWLVGTRLVTVTTSGCSNKVMKHGLCDQCFNLCKSERENEKEKVSELHPLRRRHRSAIMRSSTSEVVVPQPKIKDDFQLPSAEQTMRSRDLSKDTMQELDTQNLDRLLLAGLQEGVSVASSNAPARPPLCNCWCQGWAEIVVRRPTGNVSWMMRVQNPPHSVAIASDFPLADITTLFLPTRDNAASEAFEVVASHRRINSESLEENEYEKIFQEHFQITSSSEFTEANAGKTNEKSSSTKGVVLPTKGAITKGILSKSLSFGKETSVLRRTNSSPELSSGTSVHEENRKSRVHSDAASLAEKAKQRAQTLIRSVPKGAVVGVMKKQISEPEKKSEDMKPKISLRRHLSNKEDHTQPNTPPVLLRRGSERSVHFEKKPVKSPPLSPGISPRSDPSFRDRIHTISVPYPSSSSAGDKKQTDKDLHRSGVNPSFVFLQLYHDSCFGDDTDKPLLLPKTEVYERALKCFDRIPPYETHKIGVVYVGKGQTNNEAAILSNSWGSSRYAEFLKGLGQLIRLEEVDPQTTYIGGLGQKGEDGKFAYIWQDDVMQVIFHVATLMPTKENDPSGVSKKLHIGNDFVTIVYNDSEEEYAINTIKGQFMYACVVIQPLDYTSNLVVVKMKNDLDDLFEHTAPKIISNENLSILARQLALHANLASMIFQSQKIASRNPYASNWLERLRDLKRLRKKLVEEAKNKEDKLFPAPVKCGSVQDFTDYV